MESFRIDGNAGRAYGISVEEAQECTDELVRTVLEIDLQTFSENTFSSYTARAFLQHGHVFLLRADSVVIGTCVLMRSWDRPQEALLLAMGIRPGWRGRGLGQHFVQGILDRLAARGLRSVCLYVSQDNRRAIRVYEDTGFQVVERQAADPRTRDRMLVMRCQLQEHAPVAELP